MPDHIFNVQIMHYDHLQSAQCLILNVPDYLNTIVPENCKTRCFISLVLYKYIFIFYVYIQKDNRSYLNSAIWTLLDRF